jgi:hypothetical protein
MVVALDEARRAIDQQKADLAAARTAVTGLLGIGGVAASLLGGFAVSKSQPLNGWTWIGLGAFAAMVVVTCAVVWPYTFWFDVRAVDLVAWAEQYHQDQDSVRRNLALFLDRDWRRNGRTMWWLTIARIPMMGLLLVEIGALLLSLRGP